MKKLVLVLGLVALTVSCKKEDLSPSVEYSSSKDCNCDRIVKVFQYNVVNSAEEGGVSIYAHIWTCLLYTSPSPRDRTRSRMPSSA